MAHAVPTVSDTPEYDGRPRDVLVLAQRETAVHAVAGAGFLVAAGALAVLGEGGRPWRWDVGVVLVLAFAVMVRARFDVGSGYAPPTQLIFVPALFLVAPRYAPLIALAGWALGRVPDLIGRTAHVSRLLVVPGNCWFAVGPALVLTLAGGSGPRWGDWPVYLLALAAQFAGDLVSNVARDRVILGVLPTIEPRVLAYVWSIDLALSPIGLLAAFASRDGRFAFVGVLPLAGLLVLFSHERTRRFEAELASTRAREALIAGASHDLQTPLAVLSGLVETLAAAPHLPEVQRVASHASMRRQTAQLRYLVGQFVDYARLKAGQDLLVSPRPTPVAPALAAIADVWIQNDVDVTLQSAEVSALVDPGRLHGVVMALMSNAVRHGPATGPVTLTARLEGRRIVIEVSDRGPGVAENDLERIFGEFDKPATDSAGTGIGLYLARIALRAQGGDVRLRNRPEGGLVATVYLPATPR